MVMSYDDYVREVEHQLGNSNYYQLLPKDPTLCFTTEINKFLLEMKNLHSIDENTWKYLHSTDTQQAQFYLLPEIHKPGNPGRPIVSSNNAPTEPNL